MLDKETIKQYAKEHTLKECAIHFHKNIKTMSSYLHYNNIPFKKELNKYSEQELKQFSAFAETHTIKEFAKHFNLSISATEHIIGRYKLKHKTEREYLNQSGTRLYRIYKLMKDRCYNLNNPKFKDYGGRGIQICEEWLKSYNNFYTWAINNGYSENLTIDRTNVDKDYSPDNCTWLPFSLQGLNKRNTIKLTYKGETKPLVKWAKELNINYATLLYKYHHTEDLENLIASIINLNRRQI